MSRTPLKATLEVELTDARALLVLKVAGTVVWQTAAPLEAWHHEVVDLVVAKTLKQKLAGLLSRGLGG